MTAERTHRRLAAILVADVIGFSRLMGDDEAGTLTRLRQTRAEVLDPAVAKFDGRIVKTTGDGFLVEFGSAVDAVTCAIAAQEALAERGDVIRLRMGINLGDVVTDGDDIYGDGVNIAARLEGFAQPGGIAVSGSVHEQIRGRVFAVFDDAGEQKFKNISRPVRVWQWRPATVSGEGPVEAASDRGVTGGRKPVVAVLPFAVSGDAEAEALAEGLADDLTTVFARRRGIDVVARRTIAASNASQDNLTAIRQATGADYVLSGALRRSAGRVRITAALIQTGSGIQVWSNRYDRDWGDVFALEDDVTESIAGAARWALNTYEGRQYDQQPAEELGNAKRRAKAAAHFYDFTLADFAAAMRLLDLVLADDPQDATALAMKGLVITYKGYLNIHPLAEDAARQARALAAKSVELDRNNDFAYMARGMLDLQLYGDCQAALADARRSLAISPGYILALHLMGEALIYDGDLDDGIPLIDRTIAFDPRDPVNFLRHWILAKGHFLAADYASALVAIEEAQQSVPGIPVQDLTRAAILAKLGRRDEAREIVQRLLDHWPEATIATVHQPLYQRAEARQTYLDALRDAGMPE